MRSEINSLVSPAKPKEFSTPSIGPIAVWPPVILAPMAGVTNAPFRTLCKSYGAGLYVSEMITARGLLEGHTKTQRLSGFAVDENPRSIQLYGTEPKSIAEATKMLVAEGRVDHIDLNFGCPMPKVTRKGGGAALPLKPRLFESIVASVVIAADLVPVTVKFRKGTDNDHLTFLDAGAIAESVGVSAVALHARTAEQLYSGTADWDAVSELKAVVSSIPVFGNGDIWEPWDALRMMRMTGCDGVVVGRGCLGRPWLFGQLATVFGSTPTSGGSESKDPPLFGEVTHAMVKHAQMLTDWAGPHGIKDFRKHTAWYLKGYQAGPLARRSLQTVKSLENLEKILEDLVSHIGADREFDPAALRLPRSHKSGPKPVILPAGWLDNPSDTTPPPIESEALVSGG